MELYLEPNWIKRDTRFKKGHIPWNKGRKCVSDDPQKRENQLKILAEGRRLRFVNGTSSGGRKKVAVCAYDLDGEFIRVFPSIREAGTTLGLRRENIRACVANKRKSCGQFQFRKADIVEFQGRQLVKKNSIEPYRRGGRSEKTEKGGAR